jgi:hypothetical protein
MNSSKLDNANPTVLSASDLPSHRQTRKFRDAATNKPGIRDVLMTMPSYAMDPFYLSDFSDEDSDDSTVEPIDEQEIYGKHFHLTCFPYNLLVCSYTHESAFRWE